MSFLRYYELRGSEQGNILLFTNIHRNKFLCLVICVSSILVRLHYGINGVQGMTISLWERSEHSENSGYPGQVCMKILFDLDVTKHFSKHFKRLKLRVSCIDFAHCLDVFRVSSMNFAKIEWPQIIDFF